MSDIRTPSSIRGVAVLSKFRSEVRTASNGSSFIDLRIQVGTDDRPVWAGAKLFHSSAKELTAFRDQLATNNSVLIEGPASARVNVHTDVETGEAREAIGYTLNLGRLLGYNRAQKKFLPLSLAFLGVTPTPEAPAEEAAA